MAANKLLLFFASLFSILLFFEPPKATLFEPDEARYAEIPREMLATGDFITPHLNGSTYLEKPPLLYWLNSLSFKLFGESSFAARLVARLSLMFVALIIAYAGSVWAAVIYLSSLLPFALGRVNIIDGLLTAMTTWCMLALMKIFTTAETEKPQGWLLTSIGVSAALAVLSKGLVGVVIPGLVVLGWCLYKKTFYPLRLILYSRATFLFLIVTAPWFILIQKAHPDFFDFFFIREHLLRYSTNVHNREEPLFFFVITFLWGFFPWTPFFIRGVFRRYIIFSPQNIFLSLWFSSVVFFFSFSHSKLIPYILPAFPAAALLLAEIRPFADNRRSSIIILVFTACLYLALILIISKKAPTYSAEQLANKSINMRAELVNYRCYPEASSWTLKNPVPVVEFKGELASIEPTNPTYFWTEKYFWQRWQSIDRMCVLTTGINSKRFVRRVQRKGFIVGSSRNYKLICNFSDEH